MGLGTAASSPYVGVTIRAKACVDSKTFIVFGILLYALAYTSLAILSQKDGSGINGRHAIYCWNVSELLPKTMFLVRGNMVL
jgi:hypothetical protein